MLRFCKRCEVILGTYEGEVCLPCITETATKETAVIPNISDSELRARIYREAMLDAAREGGKLLDENARLRKELADAERRMKRYQEEILELERHNEELFAALNSVRNTLMRASDDIESLIRVD